MSDSTEAATAHETPRFVLKWPMPDNVMTFRMPGDAEVVEVQTQHGIPTLWTLGSADAPDRGRTFLGFGTGHPIFEDDLVYVGSAHDVYGDGLVFHIFERPDVASTEADQ